MAFVNQKFYHVCAFSCILMSVAILAHRMPPPSSSSSALQNDNAIRFPNQIHDRTLLDPSLRRTFIANVTECAETNQSFCTTTDNYPVEYVRRLLREHAHRYPDALVNDAVSSDVSIRLDDFDVEHLCSSYDKVIYPTSGVTKDGSERFILNTDEYKQGVRVSLCRNVGQPCRYADSFPTGYKTECRQQMVYRQMLSLGTDGNAVKNHFEFPACCECVLHKS